MIDLEKFPTSPAAIRMLKTVSPIYDRSYVAKWLYQVMGIEIDEAWQLFEELRHQAFPETATWGIIYWEQRYNIEPDENLTLEQRRQRVIVKRGKRSPMNPAMIELLSEHITKRQAEVIERNSVYAFTIAILSGESQVDYKALIDLIKSVKPSHLAFDVIFETRVVLSISDEPESYRFNYGMIGTSRAGEHPSTNIMGAITETRVIMDTDMDGHLYPYTVAGTVPDTNMVSGMSLSTKSLDVDVTNSYFGYHFCGVSERNL